MNGLMNTIRPYLSRLLAIPVAGALTWLTARYTLQFDARTQAELTRQIVEAMIQIVGEFVTLYAATHRIASIKLNPSDAAAPSMAKAATGPLGEGERSALGETWEAQAGAAAAEQMRAAFTPVAEAESPSMPVIPLPVPAPNAATSRFIEGYECPFCTGENGAHHGWCRLVGGDGVAPPGFVNDTRRINHAAMRKAMAEAERGTASPAVMAAVRQAIDEAPPAERSRVLKPKPVAEKPKDVVKVRRKPRKAR